MHNLFCRANKKNVLQKEIKNWTFEFYLVIGELISWLILTESFQVTSAISYVWFSIFCQNSNGEGLWIAFRGLKVLPKPSEITVTCPNIVKMKEDGQF